MTELLAEGPWRAAFEEAWASYCDGNWGIGAVLVDDTGAEVSRGRNRVVEPATLPGVLASTMLAHAEMNCLAAAPAFGTHGLTLYTTLEPCLMCAATTVMTRVAQVHFAARDHLFAGLEGVLRGHPFADERHPVMTAGPSGVFEVFARVLPATFNLFWMPGIDTLAGEREQRPDLVALAEDLLESGRLNRLAEDGATVHDVIDDLADELARIAPDPR